MKNSKNSLKDNIVVFAIMLCGIYMAFSLFMNDTITSDFIPAYHGENVDIEWNWKSIIGVDWKGLLRGGRFTGVLFNIAYYMLRICGVSHFSNIYVLQILGMIFYALSAMVVFKIFKPLVHLDSAETNLLYYLSILIAFVNPFMIETYKYHSFDWGVGVFFAVLTAYYGCNKKIVRTIIFALLAISTYETNTFIILVLLMFYSFIKCTKDDASIKEFIIRETKAIAFCVGPALFIFGFQRIGLMVLNSTSSSEQLTAVKQVVVPNGFDRILKCIINPLKILFTCYGMLPDGILVLYCFLLFIVVMILAFRNGKRKIVVEYLFVMICSVTASFSLVLLGMSYFQRMLLSIFFIGSMMCVSLLFFIGFFNVDKIKGNMIAAGLIATLFIVLFTNTQVCITDAYTAQAIDEYEAMEVERKIEDYEKKSGNIITTIATCGGFETDFEGTYYYPGLLKRYRYAIPYHRIPYYNWSQGGYINFVNGTDYEFRIMTDEEISSLFHGETEGYFNPDSQLIFDKNTLYWRIY